MATRLVSYRHTLVNSVGTFFSRITGVLKQNVSNYLFGASQDPFWMAFRLVNSFSRYIGEGALTYAFIPVFQKALHEEADAENRKLAFKFASNIINIFLLINTVIVAAGAALAPFYAPFLVPGYKTGSALLHQNIVLTMIMMPYLLFISLYGLIMGVLNSHKKFMASAFAPFFSNIVFMLIPILFVRQLGIYSLGIAVVAGSALQVAAQLFELRKTGFRYSFVLDFKDPYLRGFMKLFKPTALNQVVITVKFYATSIFLSFFIGGPTVYMNSYLITQAPLGIIGWAIGTVMMPLLSKFNAASDPESFNRSLSEGLNMVLYLIIPIAVFFAVFPDTIVNSLFRDITTFFVHSTGKFTPELLHSHYLALTLYSAALLPMALIMIFDRVFYSLHDAKTPFLANSIIFILSAGLYFTTFIPGVGYYGVFGADMTASWMTLVYYLLSLRKNSLVNLKKAGLFVKALVLITVSLAAGALVYPLHKFVYLQIHGALYALSLAAAEFLLFGLFYYIITRTLKMDLKQ
jgi:putative peptidoglycan lipid II flippase